MAANFFLPTPSGARIPACYIRDAVDVLAILNACHARNTVVRQILLNF